MSALAARLARLDKAIARSEPSAELYARRAEARAAAGRYSHAVEDARRAVELDPEGASARRALARALARAGKLEEALGFYDDGAGERALVLLALGRGDALAEAAKAAAAAPRDATCALAHAAALAKAGRAAEAVDALPARAPKDVAAPAPHPAALRADLLAALERWPQAVKARAAAAAEGLSPAWPAPADAEALGRAIDGLGALAVRRKRDALLIAWLGQLLEAAGRDEEAASAYAAAVRAAPALTAARVWRARQSIRLGRLAEALADVKAAAKRPGPAFPAGTLALLEGDLLAALGKGRPAAAAYARAAASGPDRAEARLRRGLVLEALGEKDAASLELDKALEGDPSLRSAYEARARLRAARGDAAGAASDAARASGGAVAVSGARDRVTDQGPGEGPAQRRMGRAVCDGRLELAGLLQTKLTGATVPEFCRRRAPEMADYVEEAMGRFGSRLDSGLVEAFGRTASARANPDFPWYAMTQMMMGVTPLPEMLPLTPAWRHGEDLRFLDALRRFVERTRFDEWLARKKPLFDRWTVKLRPHLEREPHAETVSAYVGRPIAAYYDVVLSPLLRGARIRAILLDDTGARGARTVLGPLTSEAEFDECLAAPDVDALLWTGWHEHLHTVLDPWCGLYAPEAARFEPLYAGLPRMAKRKDWMDSFSEHHVRAVTQRLLLGRRGAAAMGVLADGDRKEGYRYSDPLSNALALYESDRRRWPTLLDFMPTWLKTWEDFA